MIDYLKPLICAGVLSFGASASFAATQLGSHVTLSGFGTIGVAQTDSGNTQYMRDRQLTGTSDKLDFNLDSNLGVQASVQANQWLSGTVQLLAMHRMKGNIDVEAEWAFIKVEPIDRLAIRAGRMNLPTFAVSDYRHVGYANLWIRPPGEVYGLALVERLTGADASYRMLLNSSSLTFTALAGHSSFYAGQNQIAQMKHIVGANLVWDGDGISVRLGRLRGSVQVGNPDPYTFTGVGVSYDRNGIVAQAEYVQRRSQTLPDSVNANGWYVLGGYHINKLVPYLIYADTAPANATAAMHVSGKQNTLSAGLRWNAVESAAIKFQFDRVNAHGTKGVSFVAEDGPPPPPPADFGNAPPPSPADGAGMTETRINSPVNVWSMAVDFMF